MARLFVTASTNTITASVGAFSGVPFTYGTVAYIDKWNAFVGFQEVYSNTVASGDIFFGLNSSNEWEGSFSSSSPSSTIGHTPTVGNWYCVIVSKATGNVAPRFNIYDYAAGTWSAWVGDVAMVDGSGNMGQHNIGFYTGGFEHISADVAALGLFRTLVPSSDPEAQSWGLHVDRLAWLTAAKRADKQAFWLFNQSVTTMPLLDLTGGGANQSGGTLPAISTASVPILGYGAPVLGVQTVVAAGNTYNETALAFTIVSGSTETDNAVRADTVTTTVVGSTSDTDVATFLDSPVTTVVASTSEVDARTGSESITTTVVSVTSDMDGLVFTEPVATTVVSVTSDTDVAAFVDTPSTTIISVTTGVDARTGSEATSDVWVAVTSSTLAWTGTDGVSLTVVSVTTELDDKAQSESVTTTVVSVASDVDAQTMIQASSDVATAVTSVVDVANWLDSDSFVINGVTSETDAMPGGPESVTFVIIGSTSVVDAVTMTELLADAVVATISEADGRTMTHIVNETIVSSTSVVDARILSESSQTTIVALVSQTGALTGADASVVVILCSPGVLEALTGTVGVGFTIPWTDEAADSLVGLNTPRGQFSATDSVSIFRTGRGIVMIEGDKGVRIFS